MGGNAFVAEQIARDIDQSYGDYQARWYLVSANARQYFERRQWRNMRADAARRLTLYKSAVDGQVERLQTRLGATAKDRTLWATARAAFAQRLYGFSDAQMAQTYFNSVTRRMLATVGVDPALEFLDTDRTLIQAEDDMASLVFEWPRFDASLIKTIVAAFRLEAPFEDLDRDAQVAAFRLESHFRHVNQMVRIAAIEMVPEPFFRDRAAYLVGRLQVSGRWLPVVFVLQHGQGGIVIDALLLETSAVSILFSYTRADFFINLRHQTAVAAFLHSILPKKPLAEIYSTIGHHKHGKSELYRDLKGHLQTGTQPFRVAPGEAGMVMTVIYNPALEMVFKLIKDRFDYPKKSSRRAVMKKYEQVFRHNRAGRLVNAYLYRHLSLPRRAFPMALVDQLLDKAARSVSVTSDEVIFELVYVERKVTPLDIYLRHSDETEARRVVVDYGQAIKDLAHSNIFAGDMRLKNFGLTRFGRVVFYDYDELLRVTDCHFVPLEATGHGPSGPDEHHAAAPRVYPAELPAIDGLSEAQRKLFLTYHADIFRLSFWRKLQAKLNTGERIPILPYAEADRLKHRPRRKRFERRFIY
jgi:isocitrate dehydrogenase kinase/phosphatase